MPTALTDQEPTVLEEILTSTARFRIARLLVRLPEKEFTGREMARLLGLSHSSVQEALQVLVREDLVSFRVVGRAYLHRVSRESYLYGILSRIFRADRQITEAIREAISSALGDQVVSVVLFGSRATGTARRTSDVDLIVVARNRAVVEKVLARLQTRLSSRFGVHLDAKALTPRELREKERSPYIRAALAEGRLLIGIPLKEVLASVA